MKNKEVILTGLRANGELHLGNYLGGILPMVQLQQKFASDENHQLNMFIPDLHSFTTEIDHSKLYDQIITNLKVFLAAGLDIDHSRTYIYRQSRIPAHSELAVILNNFAYFGELSRMTQFKEKSDQAKNVTAGLFDYPVLMAADILLYGSKYVPVGDDQKQHLELTRDLAQRVNNKFSDQFPEGVFETIPASFEQQLEFYDRDNGVRIRSLRHPENKMSKSIQDPAGTIMLSDEPEEAREKIMGATTDSQGEINFDFATQPGVTNLLQILALLSEQTQADVAQEYQGKAEYSQLKQAVANQVVQFLADFQARMSQIEDQALMDKLQTSEAEMASVADNTLKRVQRAVGLRSD